MGDLEVDTRLEALGEGRFGATLSSDWEIWGPNGGYLAAVALRACGEVARVPRPVSFTCHFLRRGEFREAEICVRALQQGRRSESLSFELKQDGRVLAAGMLRTAAEGAGLQHDVSVMPRVPGPESLQPIEKLIPDYEPNFPFWTNFERRPTHSDEWKDRDTRRAPTANEWMRFVPRPTFEEAPFLDAARAVVLIDTFTWPAAVGPHVPTEFIAPNVDLQVWFHRARPTVEWLLIDAESAIAEGGTMGTHSCVWSGEGELLATGGAQLLCVPPQPKG